MFFSSWLAAPFSSLILFISYETLVSIQNSPPLSRLFTFKYFKSYFPKKEEIALHEIFKL